MKILFAGGGTGGHFYPIIAVAEAVLDVSAREHLLTPEFYFMSDDPIDPQLLKQVGINYIEVKTGKRRTYKSFQNFLDIFKTFFACIKATWKMFLLYPDIVFGKGGYASFPALFAARLLRIPVVIHESDTIPGRVNTWAADYAAKVAISYPDAAKYFPDQGRVALTGQPIRKALLEVPAEDPESVFHLESNIPTILVLGGSQGAANVNEHVMDIMPQLVEKYQVIHQTGEANLEWMKKRAGDVLHNNPLASRYHPFAFLESKQLHIAAKAAVLVISRAGSAIFEIAHWGVPSIIIPIPPNISRDQTSNAYSYARTGSALVVEEANLKSTLFLNTINSLIENEAQRSTMKAHMREFAHSDAAEKIAQALLSIAVKHN